MGFNIVAFVKRKPGMSPEAFKDYYENVHIPTILSMAGDVCFQIHRRQYLTLNETKKPVVLLGDRD
ncbi:hypothetical protein EV356DRAFT_500655, partial [Viridothelium virens]